MDQNLFCNLNGHVLKNDFVPFSSKDDLFRLRFGLYETYLYKNNTIEHEILHWERLLEGLNQLGFTIPATYSAAFFSNQIHQLAQQNQCGKLSRIRLQIFSQDLLKPYQPQYLIELFQIESSLTEWLQEGIVVDILNPFFKEINFTSNCKISHNKHFVLARKAMIEHSVDDVLLLNTKGNIIESAVSNLFWIKDKKIFTPPLSEGCLAGTLRFAIIASLKFNEILFEEKPMTLEDLRTADELFLTNSIRKIRWIRQVGQQKYRSDFLQLLRKKGVLETLYL